MAPVFSLFAAIGHSVGIGAAATAGAAATGVGAATAVGAGIAGAAAYGVKSVVDSSKNQANALKSSLSSLQTKSAAEQAKARAAAAQASSQAAATVQDKQRRIRSASQTVYTSPLGIGGMASTAKKYLLGR